MHAEANSELWKNSITWNGTYPNRAVERSFDALYRYQSSCIIDPVARDSGMALLVCCKLLS